MHLRLGGVPEHFNFPWHYALSKGYFAQQEIEIHWQDYAGGTGAMATALKNNDLDMGLLLTEGAVKEIASGAEFKIVRTYVQSALRWGIHSGHANANANLKNLSEMRYAISRLGSGSHLMAYVHAKENGMVLNERQMLTVGNLQGAREALAANSADLFFWERFTTKPLVDSGEMKLLGEFPTPWPCFMMVARNDFFLKNREKILNTCTIFDKAVSELVQDPTFAKMIGEKYQIQEKDIIDWLATTQWSHSFEIQEKMLQKVQHSLQNIGMLERSFPATMLVHDSVIII